MSTDRLELTTRLRAAHHADQARSAIVVSALVVLLVVALAAAVLMGGTADIPLADVPAALLGRGTPLAHYVVFETRLPRALAALLAGVAFGASGRLYQRVVRNPLATPDIVGITAGASMGAVTVIVLTPVPGLGLQAAAVGGALLLIGSVFALTWRSGVDTYRLILVGIGMSAVGTAVTSYVLMLADETGMAMTVRWTAGSVAGTEWQDVRVLLLVVVVVVVAALWLSGGLRGLDMGDDLARGLGVRVGHVRVAVLTLGAVAAALTTSTVGPIGFVALVSGPIATRLVPRGRHLLVASLVGALLVVAADVVAQNAPYISPVPTGVLTAIVGAPVFVWLLLVSKAGTIR